MKEKFLEAKEPRGREVLDILIAYFENNDEEYRKEKKRFDQACRRFQKVSNDAEKLMAAYEKLNISNAVFAFDLGKEDSLAHFTHPNSGSFLEEDIEEYLHENEMELLPDAQTALNDISVIKQNFSNEADKIYDTMLGYYIMLETYIPKMAHYFGYMWACQNLISSVPDYVEDTKLTKDYTDWLSQYFGYSI